MRIGIVVELGFEEFDGIGSLLWSERKKSDCRGNCVVEVEILVVNQCREMTGMVPQRDVNIRRFD
jgi:hypothetical protein